MSKYKTFKNVYREPLMLGLPSVVFWVMVVSSLVLILISWIISFYMVLFSILVIAGLYAWCTKLVDRHGVNFFDKLLAHYTELNFKIIKVKAQAKQILAKKK